jgi:hypothetical protein
MTFLFMRAYADATSGATAEGVLGVHCELPGRATITEGITLTVDGTRLNFMQESGATLFHVLDH